MGNIHHCQRCQQEWTGHRQWCPGCDLPRPDRDVCVVTHDGWFGFCPVWIANPDGTPDVLAKYRLHWLLDISAGLQHLANHWLTLCDPHHLPQFSMQVRELPCPHVIVV